MTRAVNTNRNKSAAKVPRKASPSETHANNHVAVETSRRLVDPTSWIKMAEAELNEMNKNKAGRPYKYCDSMLMWVMLLMGYFNCDYRHISGICKSILGPFHLESPCYSTVFKRIRELSSCIILGAPVTDSRIFSRYTRPCQNDRVRDTAVDSTGLNLTEVSLWRKNKWGVGPDYHGWLKLHALTDCDTNEILAYVLTDDQVSDTSVFCALVELAVSAGYRIGTLKADAAYGSVENFKQCSRLKIKFIPKLKSNTQPRNNGSSVRGEAARLWTSVPYKLWLEKTGYGRRWKIESAFSDLKRLISEHISARDKGGMNVQVISMVKAYNIHKEVRNEILRVTGNGIVLT